MTHFEASPDLPLIVAAMNLRTADRLAGRVADLARAGAPPAQVWVTHHDERVRPTHVHADGQTIPANIRFILEKVNGGTELARGPRDPQLSQANSVNCRCLAVAIPGLVGASIRTTQAVQEGSRVRARVETSFDRVVESEFPSEGDSGGHWMGHAVDEVAASLPRDGARRT